MSTACQTAAPSAAATPSRAEICAELQTVQRDRTVYLKSRIMISNRLLALVAGNLGYRSGMEEKDRKRLFKEAAKVVAEVRAGDDSRPDTILIRAHNLAVDQFNASVAVQEEEMLWLVGKLPVAAWVKQPTQRGFGLLSLAIVVGECGDLSNYANPAKLWKRLGCAPISSNGTTAMGATWRRGKEGKLSKLEWEAAGYCPRRRSIMYVIGENLMKQNGRCGERLDGTGTAIAHAYNTRGGEKKDETEVPDAPQNTKGGDGLTGTEGTGATHNHNGSGKRADKAVDTVLNGGPYRARYDEAKASLAAKHPDYPPMRCHLHGMLLASKRLLRELWCAWRES